MRELCAVLGDPQHQQPTVHVTGTNGKGSVARLVTALLGAHDLTVGTYTSPHLERINERISRNGQPIARRRAGRRAHRPRRHRAAARAPAVLLRAAHRGRLPVVLRRGRGRGRGRGGPARALGRHQRGRRPRSPCSPTSATTTPTDGATGAAASPRRRPASSSRVRRSCWARPIPLCTTSSRRPPRRSCWRRDVDFGAPRTGSRSAAGCSTCARRAAPTTTCSSPSTAPTRARTPPSPWPRPRPSSAARSTPTSSRRPSRSVTNPGRFEVVQRDPLLILDGAHNPDGAQAVVETLAEGFVVTGDLRLVIGMLDGRDPVELLEILDAEDAAEVVCCAPDSPRALPGRRARRARPRPRRPRPGRSRTSAARSRRPSPPPTPTTSCSSPARSTRSAPRAPRVAAAASRLVTVRWRGSSSAYAPTP